MICKIFFVQVLLNARSFKKRDSYCELQVLLDHDNNLDISVLSPSRGIRQNFKQVLSDLNVLFRRLRSKFYFIMRGLSGF